MTYIIDIILVIIFAFTVISSYRKGFFLSLFDLLRTIISFILARIFSQAASPVIYTDAIEPGAENYLSSTLGNVGTTDYVTQAEQVLNSIPESFNTILQMLGIDKAVLVEKVSSASLGGNNLVETLMNNVVEPVATALIQFVLFVVLIIVVSILLKIIVKLLDKAIKKLPKIKSLNTFLGCVFGVLRGVLVVAVASMVLVSVAGFVNNESFVQLVNNSIILQTVQGFITSISGLSF